MRSLWNDNDAAAWTDDLGLRVYTSRLLGGDPTLVLHGGGNTSVKTEGRARPWLPTLAAVREREWLGPRDDRRPGFAPVRLDACSRLATLEPLSDLEMAHSSGAT